MEKNTDIERFDKDRTENTITPMGRDPFSLEVKNLIVASTPRQDIVIGLPKDIVIFSKKRKDVQAIIWNEEGLALLLDDRSTQIRYEPEIDNMAKAFFQREKRRHYDSIFSPGTTVWEGDFQPVRFTKTNLLKFISRHKASVPNEVTDAIKSLKLKQTQQTDSILLEDDGERTIEEERTITNLPKNFTLNMPISQGIRANLEFEAKIIRDDYGKGRPTIELQCVNARQVLRDIMEGVISQFPKEIPRYYGKLNSGKKEE